MDETPIAIFAYKRVDTLSKVLEAVLRAGRRRVIVVSNAAANPTESEKVEEVRRFIKDKLSALTDVRYLYSDTYRDVARQIYWGIGEVFATEERAIFLEDDCVPSPDFFKYADYMLDFYANDETVMHISGLNMLGNVNTEGDYFFSRFSLMNWGWATWRSAWEKYDFEMGDLQEHANRCLQLYCAPQHHAIWSRTLASVKERKGTWDVQWNYALWKNNGYAVMPAANLVANIGFGEQASHMKFEDETGNFEKTYSFPLPPKAPPLMNTPFDREIEDAILDLIRKAGQSMNQQKIVNAKD